MTKEMKIKPQIYAQMLVEALTEKSDKKQIAERFWYLLQKNKQYKDLPKILEMLDLEYAKKNGLQVAQVYSDKPLKEQEIEEIKTKLSLRGSKNDRSNLSKTDRHANARDDKFIIKNIIQSNNGGITVKVDDKIIDLSVSGKINNLKQRLVNI